MAYNLPTDDATFAAGKFGQAIVLPGNGNNSTQSTLRVPASGDFGVALWMKRASNPGDIQLLVAQQGMFWVGIDGNGRVTGRYGGSAEVTLNSTVNVCDGNWHYIQMQIGTFGGTIHVDGTQVAASTISDADAGGNRGGSVICVGRFASIGSFMYSGAIDEVAVYAGTRSTAVPSAAASGTESGTLALWAFDGNGNDIANASAAPTPTPTPAPSPSPSTKLVARTDASIFYAPGAWADDGTSANANSTGAYLKTVFTGTTLAVNLVGLTGLGAYPVLRAYVDNLPAVDVQLTAGMTQAVFYNATLSSGSHTLRLVVAKINEEAGCWSLANAVKITGIVLDSGASLSAPSQRSRKAIFFGDSLIQGVRVNGTSPVYPGGMDGTLSVAPLIAEALDAEVAQIGYGAQGYTGGGSGGQPSFPDAFGLYSAGVSRLASGVSAIAYDYVMVMHGTNGSPTAQSVIAANISALRTAHPNAWLIYIVPPGGFSRAGITAAVNAARTAGDRKLLLIDAGAGSYQAGLNGDNGTVAIGGPNETSADGVHPWARTNARLAAEYVRQIQRGIEPRRFTVTAA